jgi:hypothetical protein
MKKVTVEPGSSTRAMTDCSLASGGDSWMSPAMRVSSVLSSKRPSAREMHRVVGGDDVDIDEIDDETMMTVTEQDVPEALRNVLRKVTPEAVALLRAKSLRPTATARSRSGPAKART